MKKSTLLVSACSLLAAVAVAGGCKKDEKKAAPATPAPTAAAPAGEPAAAAPAAPTAPAPAPAPGKMVELDLSKMGPDFKGLVIQAPEGAELDFDDTSHHIKWGESEYISLEIAPYWEDSVAGLAKDKDNQNIVVSKGVMARWERTPPLGKSWLVDVLAKIDGKNWSCNNGMTGTFTSKEMADTAEAMCKTFKKK